ncbi:unnamed protein product [Prunus armeniaca]|uniref:Phytocyanin domain-containing protein n=1 Tax=Prunus armeniaca TaxID=36596 RepID=A0A6J5WTM0_PRUAR|nr:unnamed protein product [Prunus armeniaca]
MESKMVIVFGLVVSMFLQSVAAQKVHEVGDSIGWTIPQSGGAEAYVTWAANNKFVVGDILFFNFTTTAHDVLQVPKASFDSCRSDNAIGSTITTGPANVTLTSAGEHYFICTLGSHCQSGQKLAITVSGSATAPGASPPSVPPPPPAANSPPTTPSPTSNDPAACPPPVAAPSPSSTDPNVNTPPPPPPASSSGAVFASFFLSSLALVMGLFF